MILSEQENLARRRLELSASEVQASHLTVKTDDLEMVIAALERVASILGRIDAEARMLSLSEPTMLPKGEQRIAARGMLFLANRIIGFIDG